MHPVFFLEMWIQVRPTPTPKKLEEQTMHACNTKKKQLSDFLTELLEGSSQSCCSSGPPRCPLSFTRSPG